MKVHFAGRGEAPPGCQFPSLCGKVGKGDYIAQTIQQVTCGDCIGIIKKRG